MKVWSLLLFIPFKFVFANYFDFIKFFWTPKTENLVFCSENIEDTYFEGIKSKVLK